MFSFSRPRGSIRSLETRSSGASIFKMTCSTLRGNKMAAKAQIVSRKRKLEETHLDDYEVSGFFPLNDLNQDLLERVLSRLPASSFFRLTSVCKRWKSVAHSPTFNLACSEVRRREPWFLMVRSRPDPTRPTTVFDSSENNWKQIKTQLFSKPGADYIPVASSGGFICFHRAGEFVVSNPVTSSSRRIPAPQTPILAVALSSTAGKFRILLISGELPHLAFSQYHSATGEWGESIPLTRKSDGTGEYSPATLADDECTNYFLSKSGDIVSADIERSPSKQFSSILTVQNGGEILYFLSSSGTIVSCNLSRRIFSEYPRILPVLSEYSIDLIESGGEMRVVLLSEIFETSSLRVWAWDCEIETWRQVAAMPPHMSHGLFGKKADVNCTGSGGGMLVCVSSEEACSNFMCNLEANEWVELDNGAADEFVNAFSFEPRIEACVAAVYCSPPVIRAPPSISHHPTAAAVTFRHPTTAAVSFCHLNAACSRISVTAVLKENPPSPLAPTDDLRPPSSALRPPPVDRLSTAAPPPTASYHHDTARRRRGCSGEYELWTTRRPLHWSLLLAFVRLPGRESPRRSGKASMTVSPLSSGCDRRRLTELAETGVGVSRWVHRGMVASAVTVAVGGGDGRFGGDGGGGRVNKVESVFALWNVCE
ncbi:F-box only protein 13 [Striga hermonthica]|uniref:F-box only protein 13 n=1 Tax=Striga hermonthica TaxID=68872 RepID=A0A9N7MQR6_STRHE|nr:F-box only protein 13 [Striga hermonthica]